MEMYAILQTVPWPCGGWMCGLSMHVCVACDGCMCGLLCGHLLCHNWSCLCLLLIDLLGDSYLLNVDI